MSATRRTPAQALRERRTTIAILALAGAILGFLWGISDVPRYAAGASLVATGPNGGAADLADLERYAELAGSERVAEEAAGLLGGDVAGADLVTDVTVEPGADGATLEISATSDFPDFAAASADAFGEALTIVTDEDLREELRAKRDELDPDSEDAVDLDARIEALGTPGLGGPLSPGAAAAIPSEPSENRSAFAWTLGGLLIGALAGVALALLGTRRTGKPAAARRSAPAAPHSPEDALGVPVLCRFDERGMTARRTGPAEVRIDADHADSFRILAEKLGLGGEDAPRELAFLDAVAGGRADSIGVGVAVAAAELGLRVVVVEADLANPTLASRCRVDPSPGLRDYLDGAAAPRDVLRRMRARVDDEEPLTLVSVPAGDRAGSKVTSVAGPRFAALAERLPRVYDLVIVEAPPVLADDEARTVARLVESVVLVATAREDPETIERCLEILGSDSLAGAVLIGDPE